jgi:hypothetical protein
MSFYGTDFAAARRNRLDQYQDALQRILQRRQAANANYQSGESALNIEKPNVLRGVLSNFAGRGMAYSSGYGTQVQNTETDFANQLSQLASQRNATLSDADIQQGQEDSQYNYDLADYGSQQAQYEAQQRQEMVAALAAQRQQEAQLRLTQAKTRQALQPRQAPRSGGFNTSGLRRRF